MRIAGVEIRRVTQTERDRISPSAWWGTLALLILAAVVAVALDLGWVVGYLIALLAGLVGAYWLLRSAQR